MPMIEPTPRWWREREFWGLLLIAVAIYAPRLTLLTIRGEESRRAVIAREMIDGDDWIVPRTQGVVRLSRPPLQNWLIAGLATIQGEMNTWAVRLPGLICTIATILLIYAYSRRWLPRLGAFTAAFSYATMLQILEQGRTGETEPVFTAFIAGSLLSWHGLWEQKRPTAAWIVGGGLAGLAMLTKGLQAPVYFFGSTWIYLLVTRQGWSLLRPSHLAGLATFLLVIGSWQLAFVQQMGWQNGLLIYTSNVAKRFHDDRLTTFIVHLLTYPPAVVIGCLAPWSLLLVAYADRTVRKRWTEAREPVVFALVCVGVCFPSVWLPPEARPRYFMPLFPCISVLIGVAVQLLAEAASERPHRLWTFFVRGNAVAMILAAVTAVTLAVGWSAKPFAPPLREAIVYATIALGLAAWVVRFALKPSPGSMQRACLGIGVFMGVSYVGPVMTTQAQRSENLPAMIADLKAELPPKTRLISFDHVHHVFLYYFGDRVQLHEWPQSANDVPADAEYFCIHVAGKNSPDLPFAWTPVASVSVDRNHNPVPKERIIIGRREPVAEELDWPQKGAKVTKQNEDDLTQRR